MIVVGSTMTAFAMGRPETYSYWLHHAKRMKELNPEVQFFAALQTDARGLEPFEPLLELLKQVDGDYWTYQLDDFRTEVTSDNRIKHICMGRNLIVEYTIEKEWVTKNKATHILYLDADTCPQADIIPKLLEMNHPLVAGYMPTYNINGPLIPEYPYPVMDTWASAGCLMAGREVFLRIRWRHDIEPEMTDDPCYYHDAKDLLGIRMHVRRDVDVRHFPQAVGPLESRGYDRRVIR